MNLVCIRHRDYDGTTSPTLSCKTCCGIFIMSIKRHNATKSKEAAQNDTSKDAKATLSKDAHTKDNVAKSEQADTYKWLERKAQEGRTAYKKAQESKTSSLATGQNGSESPPRLGFNPFTL